MNELNEIKKLRKRINLTQAELARECGVSSRTVQNWEKGETVPESMRKLLDNIVEKYESNSLNISSNTNNIKSNNVNSDDAIKMLTSVFENQLKVKDEQIDRLLALLEKRG
jgi:transcriptional regulator with XRE-family HTH domain